MRRLVSLVSLVLLLILAAVVAVYSLRSIWNDERPAPPVATRKQAPTAVVATQPESKPAAVTPAALPATMPTLAQQLRPARDIREFLRSIHDG